MVIFAIAVLALFTSGVAIRGAPTAEAANQPDIAPGSPAPQYPGADNITIYLQCQPDGRVALTLNWVSYGFGGQFVDLSLFNNNWIFGTFIGQGPLPAYQNQFTWNGLLPNAQHYVRINTGTQFGWQPSQTYVFTTSNCAFNPNPYPPNPYPGPCGTFGQPACPGPCGGYNCGPPVTPCGPNNPAACVPTQCTGSPTYASYVAGNCAPAGACSTQATAIAIFPPPPAGCVWTQKGEGTTYALGELVTYCYYVNEPMWVHIVATLPNGQQLQILPWVWDDGTGGCAYATNPYFEFRPRPAGQPLGQRVAYLYGGQYAPGQLLDTATFTVQ
jgi:hypothetical protein